MTFRNKSVGGLSVRRAGCSGAAVMAALFALCWIGAQTGGLTNSHMFIWLFTTAAPSSATALAIGLCWSSVFGALAGALVALSYNATAALDR